MSNKSNVLTTIPESHSAKDMKRLDMDQDLIPAGEVFDVDYCIHPDSFLS